MKFCIGVDFDNTIACYDNVFVIIAKELYLIEDKVEGLSKAQVKDMIMSQPDGDINWQRLQGQIYGKYMHKASIFPGFTEFLFLANQKGHQVSVVSHKSPYGHFDEEKIPLRVEAMKWLLANKLAGDNAPSVPQDKVFFEPTRESKIDRIISLGCTHFIDDLQEVFDESSFPVTTNQYLFDPQKKAGEKTSAKVISSWRSITRELIGEWTTEDICKSAQIVFPFLQIEKAALKKGRGNSRIFMLSMVNGDKCALKIYPDLQSDRRTRLETEFSACTILAKAGFPVTNALAKDENLNWAIYSWIDGHVIDKPDHVFIETCVEFIKRLALMSRATDQFRQFSEASEACLSGLEITKQIEKRLSRLNEVNAAPLADFLENDFMPVFVQAVKSAKIITGNTFQNTLDSSLRIPSPSDFGAHNAIRNERGQITFIDFEYFGWDDPVKLVADFYWHPAMNLSEEVRGQWIDKVRGIFTNDLLIEKRLEAYLPLFGLRWCLILLNEFLPERLAKRIHADHAKETDSQSILSLQLKKSKDLLKSIKKSI